MAYSPYYAPYYRPTNYYNPSVPQDTVMPQQMQQMQQQQVPMQFGQQMVPSSDLLWVLNEMEATSYPVAANNSVTLWDKNKDTVYIKSVNAQGVPSMRILDYKERASESAPKTSRDAICDGGSGFVREDDFKALCDKFDAIRGDVDELKAKANRKSEKKVACEDEQ